MTLRKSPAPGGAVQTMRREVKFRIAQLAPSISTESGVKNRPPLPISKANETKRTRNCETMNKRGEKRIYVRVMTSPPVVAQFEVPCPSCRGQPVILVTTGLAPIHEKHNKQNGRDK